MVKIANRTRARMRGSALLSIVLLLLTLSLVYLTGSAHQLVCLLSTQHQQSHYLKNLNNTLSALAVSPYLLWNAATPQWQCRYLVSAEICLKQICLNQTAFKQNSTATPIMLLRVRSPIAHYSKAQATQYRFVYQKLRPAKSTFNPATAVISSSIVSPTLFWISGGWLDLCPEHPEQKTP